MTSPRFSCSLWTGMTTRPRRSSSSSPSNMFVPVVSGVAPTLCEQYLCKGGRDNLPRPRTIAMPVADIGRRFCLDWRVPPRAPQMKQSFTLSSVLASLSHALDLTEGQPAGHSIRACLIGMEIGKELGLSPKELSDLYYALLLKDAGCSANAAPVADLFGSDDQPVKRSMKLSNWSGFASGAWYMIRNAGRGGSITKKLIHIVGIVRGGEKAARELTRVRCERGAKIAGGLGFAAPTCEAIRHLDEHWDGAGHPYGVDGDEIPLLARICSISQTVEVFLAQSGKNAALRVVRERREKWFGPDVSDIVLGWSDRGAWWEDIASATDSDALADLEPRDHVRR
ncbi:MAG TPA: hypothetical protein EYQ27_14670, partial [Gemmatimonadetes bacterium]|nr:hypothetical protein [Gemmatimonadota bacterium]